MTVRLTNAMGQMKMQCSGLDPAAGKDGWAMSLWVTVQDQQKERHIFYV